MLPEEGWKADMTFGSKDRFWFFLFLAAGAIIGGGAFGDNLAPVSDTTICSALTQGADITGVVKSRLRYSAVAAAITILFILFFGGGGSITGEALPHD